MTQESKKIFIVGVLITLIIITLIFWILDSGFETANQQEQIKKAGYRNDSTKIINITDTLSDDSISTFKTH